jgi:hypothetical protein
MISPVVIRTKYSGLVGWENPTNPTYAIVSAGNQASRSGRYVNSNPFVKVEYIKDTQDYSAISDANFNTLLSKITTDAAVSVCDKIFNEPDFIDRQMLYKNANNRVNTETLPTGFVGYRIRKSNENDIAIEIRRCLLEFQGTGTIKLLLFNSNKSEPLQSKEVSITSSAQEVELNWVIDNTSTYFDGELFFGYISNNLSVAPYQRNYNNASLMTNISSLEIESIKVVGHITETLFDLNNIDGLSECNGLNPDITVYNDYTDLAVNNQRILAYAVMLQSQITCLEMYIASLRSNSNERTAAQMINKVIVELDGLNVEDGVAKVGLKTLLAGELQRVRKEIDRLQSNYFPKGIILNTLT